MHVLPKCVTGKKCWGVIVWTLYVWLSGVSVFSVYFVSWKYRTPSIRFVNGTGICKPTDCVLEGWTNLIFESLSSSINYDTYLLKCSHNSHFVECRLPSTCKVVKVLQPTKSITYKHRGTTRESFLDYNFAPQKYPLLNYSVV